MSIVSISLSQNLSLSSVAASIGAVLTVRHVYIEQLFSLCRLNGYFVFPGSQPKEGTFNECTVNLKHLNVRLFLTCSRTKCPLFAVPGMLNWSQFEAPFDLLSHWGTVC